MVHQAKRQQPLPPTPTPDQEKRNAQQLLRAQNAVQRFRVQGDPSGFPELRNYLWRINGYDSRFTSFSLGEKGHLTEEEYRRFKMAYKATEPGRLDTTPVG